MARRKMTGGQVDEDNIPKGLFDDEDRAGGNEDPAAPLPARVYIGYQLVSFQYEDKETKKVRTVMMVEPGDDVKLSTVSVGRPPEPKHFNATVVDIFKSGMSEYDSNLVFVNLEELQTRPRDGGASR